MKRVGVVLIIAGLVLGGMAIASIVSHMLPRAVVIFGAFVSGAEIGVGYLMLRLNDQGRR